MVDVAPTLLEYAGNFSLPFTNNIAGESFTDLLLDPSKRNSRSNRTIYGEYGQTRYARVEGAVKYITRLTGYVELYDLTNDQNETTNLIDPFSSTAKQYDLQATIYGNALRQWFSFYEDPYASGWTLPVTGKGQERAIYYNRTGWPNTPAFQELEQF